MTFSAPFSLADVRSILERTPPALALVIEPLGPGWVEGDDPQDWSVSAILGHLVHGELTDWLPRAQIILEHGPSVPFEPFDREAMLALPSEPATALLERFAGVRKNNLEALAAMRLSGADLERRGTHPELGEVSLRQLLATWAVHDLSHTAQIATALSRRYAEHVGPWAQFLPHLAG